MNTKSAKRIVARKLNVGTSRIAVKPDSQKKIKDAITGQDLENLMKEGIFATKGIGQSRGRARILLAKKKKGRRKGQGTKKGKKNARMDLHGLWIKKVRAQRKYIVLLSKDEKIDRKEYRNLYNKIRGGFFRSKAHIDSYLSKK